MHKIKSYYRKPLNLYEHIIKTKDSKKALVMDVGDEYNGFAVLNLDMSVNNAEPRALPLTYLQRSALKPEWMSTAIRKMVENYTLAAILIGYPYISRKVMNLIATKAKEEGKKCVFQGHLIDSYATELDKFGCFEGIPCTKIDEAGSSKRAMVNLGFEGREVEDLTEEERGRLNAEAACEIGLKLIQYIQARKK